MNTNSDSSLSTDELMSVLQSMKPNEANKQGMNGQMQDSGEMLNQLLQKIISAYGNSDTATTSTLSLSVSA